LKTLAFDISSNNTGWSTLELNEDKSISKFEYGNIQPSPSMSVFQRLYYFGNEVNKLIQKFKPEEIAFEESISVMGHGFTTAKVLARFSGVALYFAYQYQKKIIHLYEPTKWRKALGLSGRAHKAEVQFEIVKRLNLLNQAQINQYQKSIEEQYTIMDEAKPDPKVIRSQFKIQEDELRVKIKNSSGDEKIKLKEELVILVGENKAKLKEMLDVGKKGKKALVKVFDKAMIKIGVNIFSDTGIDTNSADSFGVNFCLLREVL
jgi:Holliday junction resolvasome RuvABC endonuclease subunit